MEGPLLHCVNSDNFVVPKIYSYVISLLFSLGRGEVSQGEEGRAERGRKEVGGGGEACKGWGLEGGQRMGEKIGSRLKFFLGMVKG